ncbi:MAG TPA: TPM domain-containing protein [Aldersonia sp.]
MPLRPRMLPALLGFLLLALLGAPVVAVAEQPLRLPTQITDQVQALDDDQVTDVQAALDDLYNSERIRLWVVYVADFAGQDPSAWSEQTAQLSALGDRDVLLSVATVDRAYAFSVPSAMSEVTASEQTDIETNEIEPALRGDDWAGAAIAAAGGIGDAMQPSGGVSTGAVLVGGAVVVAGGAGTYVYLRRRRTKSMAAQAEAAREVDPLNTDALAALPLPALQSRSAEVLVEMDNALRTSGEELELARGEFGDEAVRPFDSAYQDAKGALAQAFSIRQRLDDALPESPQQQRDLLVELINSCGRADHDLDARVAEFDAMRDLLIDAPQRLAALTQQVVDISVRIPESEQTLTALRGEFPQNVIAPIASNVEMAKGQLAFADQNITAGREAASLPAGRQGPAVAAIRAAEGALTQAGALLDAVDHAASDIRTAIAALPAVIAEIQDEVQTAIELAPNGDQELARSRAAGEAALARAATEKDTNPLGTYNLLMAADVDLDEAIAVATDRKREAERTRELFDQTLTAARSQVDAAADFVNTRRGAVNVQARTRLAEAQRHLAEAERLGPTDPNAGLAHARAAAELGSRALLAAQADVEQWQRSQQPPRQSGGGQTGAILTGILIDSVLRGGFGGGSQGRRYGSGGGRRSSPGSFGGAGSSRRIGGGRF